ncbi:MAG: rhomboid family intramembrane serine protease [Candidatus Aenigmatarchaeota archaeon]
MKVTNILIILNVIMFILTLIFKEKIIYLLGFSPLRFFERPWTIFTNLFVHGSDLHLFVNMLTLFIFGNPLEKIIGKKKFLMLYILSGISGNILYYIFYFNQDIIGIGASGSIFGILGAFAILRPHDYVVIFPFMVPIPMTVALIIWILLNVFGFLLQVGNIGYIAHLGGLFVGIILGKKFKRKKEFFIEEYLNSFEF